MRRKDIELGRWSDVWTGWRFVKGKLYDPGGTAHTPETVLLWHWTSQHLQALRAIENQTCPEVLPDNVMALPRYRLAHGLSIKMRRLLGATVKRQQ